MKTIKHILLLVVLFIAGYSYGQGRQKVFYITFPYAIPARTVVKITGGTDRLEALTHMSLTVWTEQEWRECKYCQNFGPVKTVRELIDAVIPATETKP